MASLRNEGVTVGRRPALHEALRRRLLGQPSWALLVEVFIGLGWLRATVSKLLDPSWWDGSVVLEFVAANRDTAVPWYAPVQEQLVPAVLPVVVVVVVVGELVAAAALLTGRRLATGLTVGMSLNLAFLLGGQVDPSVFYLFLQATLCLWLLEDHLAARTSVRLLTFFMAAGAVVTLASAPFVRNLDPSLVIEDPAAVLTTYSLSITVATAAALHRVRRRPDGAPSDGGQDAHRAVDGAVA